MKGGPDQQSQPPNIHWDIILDLSISVMVFHQIVLASCNNIFITEVTNGVCMLHHRILLKPQSCIQKHEPWPEGQWGQKAWPCPSRLNLEGSISLVWMMTVLQKDGQSLESHYTSTRVELWRYSSVTFPNTLTHWLLSFVAWLVPTSRWFKFWHVHVILFTHVRVGIWPL